ncbi:MAG TPA: CpaD family pilus assembly protein [Hyphomonadaceae bacterium]|nr:CpaD family pilus assembly protein [Hyphomonadaceae bacterium]
MSVRFHIVLAGASLLALGGCAQSAEQIRLSNRLHTQIQAQEVTAELKIDTVVAGEKLGSTERQAVKYFVSAYQDEGHGALIISRPSNGPDDAAAQRAASDARAIMLAEGIDAQSISEGPYDASGTRAAPLVISYRTYDAVVPNCPDISAWDFSWTGTNSTLPSFGCAVATNLAAMIADPSDLVGEQQMDAPDAVRRGVVLTKYRNGEKTSAERNQDANGSISSAVGN